MQRKSFLGNPYIIPALFMFAGLLGRAQADDRILSVDLRDVAQFAATEVPEAQVVIDELALAPAKFGFPVGVKFAKDGVGKASNKTRCQVNNTAAWHPKSLTDTIYGVELEQRPFHNAGGTTDLYLIALYHQTGRGHFFKRFVARVGGMPSQVQTVRALQDDLSTERTRFSLEVGLFPRKAILTDELNQIRKIYPLGVGGFDEGIVRKGQTSLLTPTYQGASLDRKRVMKERDDHSYYCGMPFLRMSRRNGTASPLGIHIIQHGEMIRGFDSHGCVRLREKDLYELYAILMTQGVDSIPLNISHKINETAGHPYPLRDDGYQSVVDCQNRSIQPKTCYEARGKEQPKRKRPARSCREHGLVLTQDYSCRPPLELIEQTVPEAKLLEGVEEDSPEAHGHTDGRADLGEDLLPPELLDAPIPSDRNEGGNG